MIASSCSPAGWLRTSRPAGAALLLAVLLGALAAAPARASSAPVVTSGSASQVGPTAATLTGTIRTDSPLRSCWFEWGRPPRFESRVACTASGGDPSFVAAEGTAAGLKPGTTYGWRLTATNSGGVAEGLTGFLPVYPAPPEEGQAATEHLSGEITPGPQTLDPEAPHGRFEDGLYVAYCPREGAFAAHAAARPPSAPADHTGWPELQCLKMDKGWHGHPHKLVGLLGLHNWLLGGYGDDAIWAGQEGDVIWGDYHPSGQSRSERDRIHGGAGTDWIYSSHGHGQIWTGAGDDHLALVYGSGTVHCNGPGHKTLVMRLLRRNRHWRLIGCRHIQIVPYKA